MSYELKRGEPFGDGIRRVLVEQVDVAARVLGDPRRNGGLDEAIHEARKSFKKVRSGLRLARKVLRKKDFRRENARFRRLGRLLSGTRESGVAILTLDELAKRFGSVLRPDPFAELRGHFVERHLAALWQTVETEEALMIVVKALRKARERLLDLRIREGLDRPWTTGVKRVYARGVSWMERAHATGSPEAFHEWRKEAKHLRYHLRILRPAWRGQLDRAERLLHDLTDLLGHHHDLTDLRRQLHQNPAAQTTPIRRGEVRALRALIDGRRIELEERIRESGLRVYSRKPEAVIGRLESLWAIWQAEE